MTRRGHAAAAWCLVGICVGRLWLMPLSSSLWVDELVTFFVIRNPGHPSFSVAPQVPQSLYYWLPRFSTTLFGTSEIALRLPSVVAMLCGLFFIARIAARAIHRESASFAVFAALAFRNFDYFAGDARPYGLGIAVASAAVLFLLRWLDEGKARDAAVFTALAAALWYIHLFYWPFYLYFGACALLRFAAKDTPLKPWHAALAAAPIAAALIPAALTALRISRQAGAHAFNELPTLRNLFYLLHGFPVLIASAAFWAIGRLRRPPAQTGGSGRGLALAILWWLVCPLCLFVYSGLSGNGVLIIRYASLMLPGLALTITALAARFLPHASWRPAALSMGLVALALAGDWTHLWPAHEHDNWRDAAAFESAVASDATPVLCPSPFVEAQPPVWTPDYPIPSFLYSHLGFYPLKGRFKTLPFQPAPESDRYLASLLPAELLPARRFVVYGSTRKVEAIEHWLARRPEMASWRRRSRVFDNLSVSIYDQ